MTHCKLRHIKCEKARHPAGLFVCSSCY
ncbi:hypothetical protein FLO80_12815 [Aquicoccus porphyridii]|uniref:Zn(2)-C6 fungal-type domain-containing protein n=1 Tax=Aquicoccus porphyridii TaxID=1852029 RepID=A0A5A9Z9V3_9RHOB|nr:hypothetical protein FLO80_12815 [Aquicoccus porphyridii]RAI52475.1 hypothetical protein DOO74_18110 [Rhodobacteraceae bacterium AsT-22]